MDLDTSFAEIKTLIDAAQKNAIKAVNTELITLYWNIGSYISRKVLDSKWGDKTIDNLAVYLQKEGPDYQGFNRRNLYRMKQFFEAYANNEIVTPLVTHVSWTHHLIILSRTKTDTEREFYLRLCIKEHYSKRELERQINAAVYERTMLSKENTIVSLPKLNVQSSLFKDSYIFEFLGLPENHSENELQKALIKHLKLFILELGKDFIFVGEEYKIQVGMQDFYIDLLFYQRELQCLVAFELKISEFMPEHLGKLNFYLEALDRDVKKPHENPSIGILLCKVKNDEVVEYALSRSLSPTLVAQYQSQLPDKKLLQAKLHELLENLEVNE